MKRLLNGVSLILLLLFFFHSCVYHYITHMNDEELAWLTNRHEGEFMYFQSKNGAKDTVIICQIDISNSLNPFNMTYFNTSNTEYIAGGCIHYRFNRTTGCEGSLYVQKLHNNKPISFSGGLLGRWSRETPLKLALQFLSVDSPHKSASQISSCNGTRRTAGHVHPEVRI